MKRPNPKKLWQAVDDWNDKVSPGASVRYRKDDGTIMATKTRSRASVLGDHTATIWLDGVSGCVALDRVTPT